MTTDAVKYHQRIAFIMLMSMCLMIGGYFTTSENVTITRIIKVFLRLSMTGTVYLLYRHLKSRYPIQFVYTNTLGFMFYGAYLMMGFFSLLWSTKPGYSLLQLIMTSQSLLFILYFLKSYEIYNHFNPQTPLRIEANLTNAVFIIILIFLVGHLVNPDIFYRSTRGGAESRLGGYLMNPNELGMLCVVGLSAQLLWFRNTSVTQWGLLKFMSVFYALIITGSRSSLVGFLLIAVLFVLKGNNMKIKIAFMLSMLLSLPLVVQLLILKQGDVEEVLSMTGRLPFWTALLSEGLPLEPLKGFGFMRIAYTDTFQSVHTYAGKMTHNTFIQVLMNLGFIGFTLALLNMIFTFQGILTQKFKNVRMLFIAIFIPIFINSLTEFGIFGESNYGILFWQLLIMLPMINCQQPKGGWLALRYQKLKPETVAEQ